MIDPVLPPIVVEPGDAEVLRGTDLQLDIVGKILATLFGSMADLVLLVARLLAKVGSLLTKPLLAAFEWVLAKASSFYTRVIRWSLRNSATVAAFSRS